MSEADRLRDIAASCRRLVHVADTSSTIETMIRMAEDYERRAEAVERRVPAEADARS